MSDADGRRLDAAYWALAKRERRAVDRAVARGRAVEPRALAEIAAHRAAFEHRHRAGAGTLVADVTLRLLVALNFVWGLLAGLPSWALALVGAAAVAALADAVRVVSRGPLAARAEAANRGGGRAG